VAILSVSEFEAVIGQAQIKIQKVLYERGEVPPLQEAVRTLQKVEALARQPEKLKATRDRLEAAAETIREEMSSYDDLRNDLWDLMDYLDYRC